MKKSHLVVGGVAVVGVIAVVMYLRRRQMMAPMGMPMAQTVFA